MSWGMVAVAAGSVVGGLVSAQGARSAAGAQRAAAGDANATQLAMFDQNREDMAPWREAGTVALRQLTEGTAPGGEFMRDFSLADFRRDPGYEFRLGEGRRAIEGSAAARGGALSGGTLKALERWGQDYGSAEFGRSYDRFNADRDRRFNRLSSIAGIGQTATRDVAGMGERTAGAVAGNQLAAGNATAAGYVGRASAINDTMGSLQSMYMMSRMFPRGGS